MTESQSGPEPSALARWLADVRAGVADATADAGAFGAHVSVVPTTGSTNDDVARAAREGAPEGYTVIAVEQTHGRGRRGAQWHSPAGHGLYVSTLLRPPAWPASSDPSGTATSLITLMAGVVVAEAVREAFDLRVELKWPNDVVVRATDGSGKQAFRKLAGILAEGQSDAGALRAVVLGIGINLTRPVEMPKNLASRVTSIEALQPKRAISPRPLVSALLRLLHRGVMRLSRNDVDVVRDAWRRLAPSVDGSRVRWQDRGVDSTGVARGIDAHGALRVLTDEGVERTVHSAGIEWDLDRGAEDAEAPAIDVGAFCREVEAHLCRVNGGHLIRIVGPAFELVAGWAREGVPVRVVLHGLERTVARLTAKGPRRRPVRVEFCEADVRDAIDAWRRAVGPGVPRTAQTASTPTTAARGPSLPRHIERVLVRLTSSGASQTWPDAFRAAMDTIIRDVDACLDASRTARGDARVRVIERLASIDDAMTRAAVDALDAADRERFVAQAERELAAHKASMPPAAFAEARQALLGDLARRHLSLPRVRLDA